MIDKRIWMAASLLIALLLLVSCATGGSGQGVLVGRWQLINIEAIVGEQDVDFSEFEEYVELGMAMDFASDGTFTYEVAVFLEFGRMIREIMDDTADVEAGPANLKITVEGTYEKTDDGMLFLNYDTDSLTTSPDEYCYTVGEFDQCLEIGDLAAGFEDLLLFEEGGAYYEVDGTSLTLWAEDCDYPADQSCAARFSK